MLTAVLSPSLLLLIVLMLPFVLSLCLGPRLIRILRALKAGQPIRQARQCVNAPDHAAKVGTPTMGGLLIIGSILLTVLLTGTLSNPLVQSCLVVTVVTAALGFLDDYAKITKHSSDGVSGLCKIAIQALAALGCALYLYIVCPGITEVAVPFYGVLDIGWLFIPFALLVIIGSSNAVNLTDGLDGLAAGCVAIACVFFLMLLALLTEWRMCASLYHGCDQLSVFLVATLSACIGFLWFNAHPAKVFMGDTGSLALGALLGSIAVCSGSALFLVVLGGVFVAEACSVMIQVGWFKFTRKRYGEGRRFFRMAPIHHHFEKGGVPETQVVIRFWIVTAILGCAALLLACFRGC